eukprot:s271_g46.t1
MDELLAHVASHVLLLVAKILLALFQQQPSSLPRDGVLDPVVFGQQAQHGEPGGASKKQAGGSEKFLMKGAQLLAKLSLKNAMDIREIQSTVTDGLTEEDKKAVQAFCSEHPLPD